MSIYLLLSKMSCLAELNPETSFVLSGTKCRFFKNVLSNSSSWRFQQSRDVFCLTNCDTTDSWFDLIPRDCQKSKIDQFYIFIVSFVCQTIKSSCQFQFIIFSHTNQTHTSISLSSLFHTHTHTHSHTHTNAHIVSRFHLGILWHLLKISELPSIISAALFTLFCCWAWFFEFIFISLF